MYKKGAYQKQIMHMCWLAAPGSYERTGMAVLSSQPKTQTQPLATRRHYLQPLAGPYHISPGVSLPVFVFGSLLRMRSRFQFQPADLTATRCPEITDTKRGVTERCKTFCDFLRAIRATCYSASGRVLICYCGADPSG
jgi:hypothetical protein